MAQWAGSRSNAQSCFSGHLFQALQGPHLDLIAGGASSDIHQFTGLEGIGDPLLRFSGRDFFFLNLQQAGDDKRSWPTVAQVLFDFGG